MPDFPIETYQTVVRAAIEQRTIVYSDLPGGTRTWGRDLSRTRFTSPCTTAHR
jgi:hypothetical protein